MSHFTPELFAFFEELAAHNNRDWFQANKSRFIEHVREPAIQFILDFAPHLKKISPHFTADARPSGGSLFRINRDTRFAKDKTPYKTHAGIYFKHEASSNVHAPGFYLHLEPGASFVGMGIWQPEPKVANQIRMAIVSEPGGWKKAAHGKAFAEQFHLEADSLVRPPKGVDPSHPFIGDIKRKSFVASGLLSDQEVNSDQLLDRFTDSCKTSKPFIGFLCRALDLPI
jgi:uncharacterized protein (TIGR02453 family)